MNAIKLISTGSAVPKKVVTNDDLAKIVDTNDEWIRTRTGIGERHFSDAVYKQHDAERDGQEREDDVWAGKAENTERKAENADDERAACSEAEVSGFYKIPEAMCGVQNECSGDAPAKDGAGHARPKREHKAERHVKDGRPKRRGAEENVFHEDKSFL